MFKRHYWKEMFECLTAVYAYNIVHSDLIQACQICSRPRALGDHYCLQHREPNWRRHRECRKTQRYLELGLHIISNNIREGSARPYTKSSAQCHAHYQSNHTIDYPALGISGVKLPAGHHPSLASRLEAGAKAASDHRRSFSPRPTYSYRPINRQILGESRADRRNPPEMLCGSAV
ncbi:hypothetical protein GX48_01389 [Paracoccidioides brasiliensis]|nr:hypothetical protein GX48_01389 [Paracoccidioides brasiliensis]